MVHTPTLVEFAMPVLALAPMPWLIYMLWHKWFWASAALTCCTLHMPIYLPVWLRQRIAKGYAIHDFEPSDIPAVYCLAPHGPTPYPAAKLALTLYWHTGKKPNAVFGPSMAYIPFLIAIVSNFVHVHWATPTSANQALTDLDNHCIIYPGGIKEMLQHSDRHTASQAPSRTPPGKRFTAWTRGRTFVHATIRNELDLWTHYTWVVDLFRYINRYARIGIPVPIFTLPCQHKPKLEIHMGRPGLRRTSRKAE